VSRIVLSPGLHDHAEPGRLSRTEHCRRPVHRWPARRRQRTGLDARSRTAAGRRHRRDGDDDRPPADVAWRGVVGLPVQQVVDGRKPMTGLSPCRRPRGRRQAERPAA
jgi:hypothetical protein